MPVRYELASASWSMFPAFLDRALAGREVRSICELGAGARPALSLEQIERAGVAYRIVDVSADELAKAPDGYDKVCADVASAEFESPGIFDLVLSKMLVEHLTVPARFHRNVLAMLRPGGRAFHFFPTLYAPPLVVNRLLPESVTGPILRAVQPGIRENEGNHGKFRPYYRWCRGPTEAQLRRLASVGFEVEEYVGFFGHPYYERVPPLQRASDRIAAQLVRHPVPLLTSYAQVVLRRPAE
jgi:SAM-dependent methyltransferase